MRTLELSRRLARLAVVALALTTVAACDDDDNDPDGDEPRIASVRLTVTPTGSTTAQQYIITTSSITPSPLVIPAAGATVAATALDANNTAIQLGTDFELRITPDVAGRLTYTVGTTNKLSGTIGATTAGQTTVRLQLYHTGEQHADFERLNMPITIQ